MHKKSIFKAIISIAVAMVFVMPVAAVANFGINKNIEDATSTNNLSSDNDLGNIISNTKSSNINIQNIIPTSDIAYTDEDETSEADDIDWWPMFHHDLQHTGYSTSTAPDTDNLLWNYTTNNNVHSSPAVSDGKVYVGSWDSNLYCLDATNGAFIWSYPTGGTIWSSPAVSEGKVYVGSDDYNVYCLDATNGAFIWSYPTASYIRSSPAVGDGKVFICSCRGSGGSYHGVIYCLDAATGTFIWSHTTGDRIYSSPAVANGKVYIGSYDNNLYCLNAQNGSLIWNYTANHSIYTSPAVVDGKVYFGCYDDNVYCLDEIDGSWIWNFTAGSDVKSSPAVVDGKVFFGSCTPDNKVYCLNAQNGSLIWKQTIDGQVRGSSPAVADGKLYIGTDGSFDKGCIVCLDVQDGSLIWSYIPGNWVYSSPAVADGKVYVGSYNNKIYCFGPSLTEPPEISNVQATPPQQMPCGYVNITATVTDNIAVDTVEVNITSPILINEIMTNIPGTHDYYYNATYYTIGIYDYFIWANDSDGTENTSGTYHFEIMLTPDWAPPEISNVQATPPQQMPCGYVNITATVTDNIAVDTVEVNITSPILINEIMTNIPGTHDYYYNATYYTIGTYNYSIWADDINGNENTSDTHHFEIISDGVDWWPMFHHDLRNTGYSTSTAPSISNLLWKYSTGGHVDSSLAVAYGMVYVGSYDNNLYCLDETNGSLIWNYTTSGPVYTTPAVAYGKVYVGSRDNNLYCLDAMNGSFIWSYATYDEIWGSSPSVSEGRVFFGSQDNNLYCLDATDGSLIWNYNTNGWVWLLTPAVVDGKVYFGSSDHNVYCLDVVTGAFIWSYPTGDRVQSSPAVVDGKVYIGSRDNNLYCLDASNGSLVWKYNAGAFVYSSPAVAYGNVYAASQSDYCGTVYCLDAQNGSHIWSYTAEGDVRSDIAVVDGMVYFGTPDKDNYWLYRHGHVYCIDAMNGSLIWEYTTADWVNSPAIANGKVFVGSTDKNVYCFGLFPGHDTGVTNIKGPVSGSVNPTTVFTPEVTVGNFGIYNETGIPLNMTIEKTVNFLDEDFAGTTFPPAGWTLEEAGEWRQALTNYTGGEIPEALRACGYVIGNYTYLQSASVNTTDAPHLILGFKSRIIDRHSHGGDGYNCTILTRANNTDTWADVTPWTNPIECSIIEDTYFINISSDIGTDTEVRFEFDGYFWDLVYWYLDDVKIFYTVQEYNETVNVNLDSEQTKVVMFPDWTPEGIQHGISGSINYLLTAYTQLITDENPDNECKIEMITLDYIHDVGVENIIEPSGSLSGVFHDDDEWIYYHSGYEEAVGIKGGGTYEAAIRITPDELQDYDNWEITIVKFYHYETGAHSGVIKIYEASDVWYMPGPLITSEPYMVTGNGWKEIPLSNPVVLNADEDVWISVKITHAAQEYPIGIDAGPAIDGKGDWSYIHWPVDPGPWEELQSIGLDCNWCIEAKVEEFEDENIWPPGTYPVEAVVKNYGAFNESDFTVNATIWLRLKNNDDKLFYNDNITIVNLPSGDEITVAFNNVTFNNTDEGKYRLEIITELDGDTDPRNDREKMFFTINFSDTTPPTITLEKQRIGLMKEKFIANVSDPYPSSGIDRVEFYLDDELQNTSVEESYVTEGSYEWIWTGIRRRTVKAIAYDNAGNTANKSMSTPQSQSQSQSSSSLFPIQMQTKHVIDNPDFDDVSIYIYDDNIEGAPEIFGNLDGELPVLHYESGLTNFHNPLYKISHNKRDFGGNGNIEIIYPLEFDILQQEIIEVIGNANGSNFGYYTVTRFKAKYDNNYNLFHRSMPKEIINSSVPITEDVIAIWDTSLEDGEEHYWLILDVYDAGSGLIGSDEIVVYVEDTALIQDGWPLEITSYGTLSSFNAVDVDYDGDLELFLGNDYYGDDPNFYAWHHNGKLLDKWPVDIPFWGGTYSSPAIGDLDNDGVMEIAATSGQRLYVYHPDGSLVSSYNTGQGGCLFPSMGDVDNDGVLEIIYRGCDPVLYVFTSTGDHYDGYPLFLDEPPYPNGGGSQAQAVGDINGDGFLDVVFGTNYRRLYAYTLHNQEPVDGFPLDIPGRAYGPVLGDIDNDGDIEIIVAVEDYPICCDMYVWNADGTLYPGWPQDAYAVSGGENPQIASLGDIDGDGDLEIFFTSYWHKMFAWHHDGTNVNGWPKNNIGEWIFTQPIIGDIDGDGLPDIITQSRHGQTNSIIAFNNQGEILDGFPKEIVSHSGRVYNSAPLLDDLDKDGDIEIVSRSQDQWEGGEFLLRVKVWDLQSEYNLSKMEWPMFQHDAYNTGFYTKKASGPDVEIVSIRGGLFKVRAMIKNTGSVEATGVNWSITLSGGLIPLGRETNGIIDSLPLGKKVTVSSNLILGVGKTVVTVSAECDDSSDMAERNALVLLFFIKI